MSEVLEQTQQWSEDAFILMREITMAYKDLQGIQRRGRRNFTFEAKIAAEIQARGLEISTLTTAQIQSREALISSIVSSLRGTPESNTQETRDAIKSVTEETQRSTISEEIKKAINRVVEVSDNREPLPVETQETKALKTLSIQELTYLTDTRNQDIVQRISAHMVLARKLQAARAGDSAVLVYRDLIDILEELEESPEITERILKTKGKLRTTEVKLARIKRTPIDTEAAAKPFLVVMEDENQTNAMRHIAAVALCGIYSNANEPEKVVEFQKRVMEFARTKREIDIAAKEMNRKPPEFQDLIAQHANALKRLQTVKNTGTLEEALKILREMENLETEIRPAGTPSELTINGIQTFKTCIRIKNHTLNPESEEIAPSELPHIAKRLERAGYVNEALSCLLAFKERTQSSEVEADINRLSLTMEYLRNPAKAGIERLRARQLIGIRITLENAGYLQGALRVNEELIELSKIPALRHTMPINQETKNRLSLAIAERKSPGAKYFTTAEGRDVRIWNPIVHKKILYPESDRQRQSTPQRPSTTQPQSTIQPQTTIQSHPTTQAPLQPSRPVTQPDSKTNPPQEKSPEVKTEKENAFEAIHELLSRCKSQYLSRRIQNTKKEKSNPAKITPDQSNELLRQLDNILKKHSRGIEEICVDSLAATGNDMLRNMLYRKLRDEINKGLIIPKFVNQLIVLLEGVR